MARPTAASSRGCLGRAPVRDLLLAVNGEASHGTAPLGWDICWLTTRRHDEPMAGPHRRYSYPGMGLGVISYRDTTAVRDGCLERSGSRSPDIVHLGGGVTASVYVMLRTT